jgi:NAD(P)-dependent dehydrogenase (short-subunit alcohol dehydrogenase family)
LGADITDRGSLGLMLENIVLAYGGLDALVMTAGVFFPPDPSGFISDEKWAKTFAINSFGPYAAVDETYKRVWEGQGLKASVVVTSSVNAVVPKKGSLAYDSSKTALNHLIRELAVELAPLVRVNGVSPATVIQGSSMFPRDRLISSLTKYKVSFTPSESTESLTGKLAKFYAERCLIQEPIAPGDIAEAILLLLTGKLSKTTGQIINVDGGLIEAFLR